MPPVKTAFVCGLYVLFCIWCLFPFCVHCYYVSVSVCLLCLSSVVYMLNYILLNCLVLDYYALVYSCSIKLLTTHFWGISLLSLWTFTIYADTCTHSVPIVLFFFRAESWTTAHGLYRCAVYRLLSEPMSTRLLNSISSGICCQNTQFNMYSTTSKQQEGCTFKDSHPKCFITTNFDKFHREAVAKGGESRWCFDSMFPWCTKSKVNSNGVCIYYDFIRRDGLSLAIWQLFDIVQSAFEENINMIVKIFCVCSSVNVCGTKARMDTYRI